MEAPGPAPLVLPPALTYLLARAFGRAHARRGTGAAAARLDGLLRDTARYLAASGATPSEIADALRDVCAGASAWSADRERGATLGELEARALHFARHGAPVDGVRARERATEAAPASSGLAGSDRLPHAACDPEHPPRSHPCT